MRLFGKVNGNVDRFDRAEWLTPPFDVAFCLPTVEEGLFARVDEAPGTFPRLGETESTYPRVDETPESFPRLGETESTYPRLDEAEQAYRRTS